MVENQVAILPLGKVETEYVRIQVAVREMPLSWLCVSWWLQRGFKALHINLNANSRRRNRCVVWLCMARTVCGKPPYFRHCHFLSGAPPPPPPRRRKNPILSELRQRTSLADQHRTNPAVKLYSEETTRNVANFFEALTSRSDAENKQTGLECL